MTTREVKTPAWLIERLAHGDLDHESAAVVRARLVAEGRVPDEEIAVLARADDLALDAHPPNAVLAEIRRRAAQPDFRPARRRPWVFGATFATAGALAVILALRVQAPGRRAATEPATEPTIIKGTRSAGARLYVYRHAADGDRQLADGARVAPGDLLQLAYATADQGFGVVLSIDGAGTVTQHWPEPGETRAAPLRVGGEVRLPSAYELDAAPAFERFFLVRSEQPFDLAHVVAAAHALAARAPEARWASLPLPARFNQISLALEKAR
jgi:hypothetical protein